MRFFLAAKRTFCVITLYALEIKALFFKARFVANLDDYKCVACCKRVYSCGETIKKHEVSFFLSDTVYILDIFAIFFISIFVEIEIFIIATRIFKCTTASFDLTWLR